MQVVTQHFRPEFINRVDEIVVFHSLGREQIRSIVDIQLGRLRQRLAERDITLRLDDDARDKIGEAGFDTVYGARPLEARHPIADRESAGAADSARRFRRRRSGGRQAQARCAGVRKGTPALKLYFAAP